MNKEEVLSHRNKDIPTSSLEENNSYKRQAPRERSDWEGWDYGEGVQGKCNRIGGIIEGVVAMGIIFVVWSPWLCKKMCDMQN